MKRVGYGAVAMISGIIVVGAVLLLVAQTAVRRSFDMAAYKAADPYYQALALHEQVQGGGSKTPLVLSVVLGVILAVVLGGWFLGQLAPAAKQVRLTYKAVRPRRPANRRREAQPATGLQVLPPAPTTRVLPMTAAETGYYEDDDGDRQYAAEQQPAGNAQLPTRRPWSR